MRTLVPLIVLFVAGFSIGWLSKKIRDEEDDERDKAIWEGRVHHPSYPGFRVAK